MKDIAKAELYVTLGFGGPPEKYDVVLAESEISPVRKSRIAESKTEAARAALEAAFVRVCSRGACRRSLSRSEPRRITDAAEPGDCEVCGGSVNAAAVEEMVLAFQRAGIGRLCVVGGSPASRRTLQELVGGRLALRLIEGDRTRTRRQAEDDLAWADRVVLWGGTYLPHKLSSLYSGPTVVQMNGRGVASVAQAATRSVAGRRAPGDSAGRRR